MVLGSGMQGAVDLLQDATTWETHTIAGFPVPTAAGHPGRLTMGLIDGCRVIALQGRVHLYEGYTIREVVFPIRLVYALGARRLIVTNAAGGIRKDLVPGRFMLLTDHIRAESVSLYGACPPYYDQAWLNRVREAARKAGLMLASGVYVWTSGPSYETPAQINCFERMGGDAVGMSTVPEILQARALGMRVIAVSLITNAAAGRGSAKLTHQDVLLRGAKAQSTLGRLIKIMVNTATSQAL